jgi:hypothetical protein
MISAGERRPHRFATLKPGLCGWGRGGRRLLAGYHAGLGYMTALEATRFLLANVLPAGAPIGSTLKRPAKKRMVELHSDFNYIRVRSFVLSGAPTKSMTYDVCWRALKCLLQVFFNAICQCYACSQPPNGTERDVLRSVVEGLVLSFISKP